MKLEETQAQDHEPLIAILLRNLLAKNHHICFSMRTHDGGYAPWGRVINIKYYKLENGYKMTYHGQTPSHGHDACYLSIPNLEKYELRKHPTEHDIWYLIGVCA